MLPDRVSFDADLMARLEASGAAIKHSRDRLANLQVRASLHGFD
jgi:hypothetical protein